MSNNIKEIEQKLKGKFVKPKEEEKNGLKQKKEEKKKEIEELERKIESTHSQYIKLDSHISRFRSMMNIHEQDLRTGNYFSHDTHNKENYIHGISEKLNELSEEKSRYRTIAKYYVFIETTKEKINGRTLNEQEYKYILNTPLKTIKRDIRKGRIELDQEKIEFRKQQLINYRILKKYQRPEIIFEIND